MRERLAAGPSWRTAMTRFATRPAPSGRASGDRANLYEEITDRIIAEL